MPATSVTAAASARPAPRIAIVDGALGYRSLVATLIEAEWPDAMIEAIDPFSQTMRGLGIAFGTRCDAVVLGSIGTHAEALNALSRLRESAAGSQGHPPPVVMLVGHELAPRAAELIEAGAAAILLKDALSSRALVNAIQRLWRDESASATIPEPARYGRFAFVADGEHVALGIENYAPVKTLAANAMAHVFLVDRQIDGRRAVLKIALATPYHDLAVVRRFCQRYRFFSSLGGDHVVRYLDAGVVGSWPYVVLEHLAGGDLRRRMADGLSTAQTMAIMRQLAAALARIHAGRFAHMDLKPENIFFRDDGGLVLIDFNIATPFGGVARNQATGDVLGSPFYMSPEQGTGAPVDGQSDLYSAGVIFHEMLTGERPFSGENSAQILYKHLHAEVPLLPRRLRDLQPVLDKLLAKTPGERFAGAAALERALAAFQDASVVSGVRTDH